MNHLRTDRDLDHATRLDLLEGAWAAKYEGALADARPMVGRHAAIVMSKPSLRTRVSFTVAVHRLGGHTVEVGASNTKLGKGEELQEWAAVLGRMVDAIVARVHGQEEIEALASFAGVPVVNALSDLWHPCQGLADAFTAWEAARLAGEPHAGTAAEYFDRPHTWAYLGDGNNVLHSLMWTCADLGIGLRVACPEGFGPDPGIVDAARRHHRRGPEGIVLVADPRAAVDGAEVVYTDTWISMGEEGSKDARAIEAAFAPYRVDAGLMAAAAPGASFLHCLPAQPGAECTAEVLRGPASRVLDQAENRLWTTMALLAHHVFEDRLAPTVDGTEAPA
ncbi:MAG: ornithine carbamoyltransferase [Deltaproteobacteria bacterium]|nr:MAG: ornithine carbamoyltransferase [Deltaproteobacteria bacterium]